MQGKFSAIINVSSVLGLFSQPGVTAYSATKGFVMGLTMAIGYEVKDDSFI